MDQLDNVENNINILDAKLDEVIRRLKNLESQIQNIESNVVTIKSRQK